MGNGIFGIGMTGLTAAQAGLTTAGHNIANVNTAGYSRQEIIQAASPAVFTGSGWIGQGVDVLSVRRVYADHLVSQLRSAAADTAALETLSTELARLDDLFGDPSAGLAPALDESSRRWGRSRRRPPPTFLRARPRWARPTLAPRVAVRRAVRATGRDPRVDERPDRLDRGHDQQRRRRDRAAQPADRAGER